MQVAHLALKQTHILAHTNCSSNWIKNKKVHKCMNIQNNIWIPSKHTKTKTDQWGGEKVSSLPKKRIVSTQRWTQCELSRSKQLIFVKKIFPESHQYFRSLLPARGVTWTFNFIQNNVCFGRLPLRVRKDQWGQISGGLALCVVSLSLNPTECV